MTFEAELITSPKTNNISDTSEKVFNIVSVAETTKSTQSFGNSNKNIPDNFEESTEHTPNLIETTNQHDQDPQQTNIYEYKAFPKYISKLRESQIDNSIHGKIKWSNAKKTIWEKIDQVDCEDSLAELLVNYKILCKKYYKDLQEDINTLEIRYKSNPKNTDAESIFNALSCSKKNFKIVDSQ